MKNVQQFILWLLLSIAIFFVIQDIVNNQEMIECYKWQKQAQEFADFYLVDWQKAQCEARGINVIIYHHD